MKKLLLLIIFLFPTFVFAAPKCNTSAVSISSLDILKMNGVVLVDEATFHNKNIGFNLRFYQLGDSIEYSFSVQNDSSEDFYVDSDSFNINTRYISYEVSTDDNNMVVKAGQSKNFVFKATYRNAVPTDAFHDSTFSSSDSFQLNLANYSNISNPSTGTIPTMILIAFVLSLILIFSMTRMKKSFSHYMFLCFLVALTIPCVVKAICALQLEVSTTYTISKNPIFCIQSNGEKNYYEYEAGMTFDQFINSTYNDQILQLNTISSALSMGYVIPTDQTDISSCYSLVVDDGMNQLIDDMHHISKNEIIQSYANGFCYSYFYDIDCK